MSSVIHASTVAPGIGQILIEAPPFNIIGPPEFVEIEKGVAGLRDDGVRIVVIGSTVDGYFVGHGSIAAIIDIFDGGNTEHDQMVQSRVMRELDRGPMISIAAVDGQAWGGGFELACACDLRVATERATFALPEVNVGLVTGWGGATKLARMAGEAAALRMALDGRPVPVSEALALGIVHKVVEPGCAMDAALEWAGWLAGRPPWALANAKQLIKQTRDMPLKDALREELRAFAAHCSRPDAMELLKRTQARYDSGADSYAAFGLDRG